jgi:ABC-type nitrate/sulfonate/bicarbonate transport system substrate-binding protein
MWRAAYTAGRLARLRVGIVSWTATYWPYYVGLSEGVFRQADLQVELVTLGTTAAGVAALLDERVDIAATCPDGVVEAATQGQPLRVAGGLIDRPVSSVLASPQVDRVEALRGRRVAVSDLRGSVSIVLRAFLRGHGLARGDYKQVVIGTTPAQVAAVEAGEVDAAMLTHPFEARLLAKGFRRLGRVADVVGACAFTTLNVRAGFQLGALREALRQVDEILYDAGKRPRVLASLAAATRLPETALDEAAQLYLDQGGVLARGGRLDHVGFRRLLDLMRGDGLGVFPPDQDADYLD